MSESHDAQLNIPTELINVIFSGEVIHKALESNIRIEITTLPNEQYSLAISNLVVQENLDTGMSVATKETIQVNDIPSYHLEEVIRKILEILNTETMITIKTMPKTQEERDRDLRERLSAIPGIVVQGFERQEKISRISGRQQTFLALLLTLVSLIVGWLLSSFTSPSALFHLLSH